MVVTAQDVYKAKGDTADGNVERKRKTLHVDNNLNMLDSQEEHAVGVDPQLHRDKLEIAESACCTTVARLASLHADNHINFC